MDSRTDEQKAEDKLFQERIVEALDRLKLSDEDACDLLKVSRPTITRWRIGQTAPHPLGREAVFKVLDDYKIRITNVQA